MYIIKISDWSNYDKRRCRNGGRYAFFEKATVKGGKIVAGKHSTSAEFNYCPHCGRFERRMDDHLERFCDGEYIPSPMMEGIAKEIIAGASPDDIAVEEGIEVEAVGANEPKIGDLIFAEWPGEGDLVEFSIGWIRPDKDGVMCAIFGKDGTIGAETIDSLAWDDERSGWMVAQ